MKSWKTKVRPLFYAARGLWLRGAARHCALCGGSFRRFLPKGEPSRPEAMCPRCLSLERHRAQWLLLERERVLEGASSLLHFAPEPGIRARLRKLPSVLYVTADIAPDRADTAMDMTRLGFRDASFDRLLCSHVLEHVPDDAAALRELRRVLRPGGTAILQVPLRAGGTDEDLSVTDPAERLRRFGQEDHVRFYGREDFQRRLEAAGFSVRALDPTAGLSRAEMERGRLLDSAEGEDRVFLARREP
jgi:SAM-dependent methyltransferase